MSNAMWIGFGIDNFHVEDGDPHITIAYFPPLLDKDEFGRPVDTMRGYGGTSPEMLISKFRTFFPDKFEVEPMMYQLYGFNWDVEVLTVDMPEQILEGIHMLKTEFFMQGMRFSTAFPFSPHISIRKVADSGAWIAPEMIPGPLTVGSIFVDYGNERKVSKLS